MEYETLVYMDYNRNIININQIHKKETIINTPDYFVSMIILNGYFTYHQAIEKLKQMEVI